MLGLPCSLHFFPNVLGHLYEPTAGKPLRLRDCGPPGAVGGVMEVILAELTSTKPTVEALPSHSPSLSQTWSSTLLSTYFSIHLFSHRLNFKQSTQICPYTSFFTYLSIHLSTHSSSIYPSITYLPIHSPM